MDSRVKIEERTHIYGTVLLVRTPYKEAWTIAAKSAGGRWKYPFADEDMWQFTVHNVSYTAEIRDSITSMLEKIFPSQEPAVITLDRGENNHIEQAPPLEGAEPQTDGKKTASAADIAKVVVRVVRPEIDARLREMQDAVDLSLNTTRQDVSRSLSRTIENIGHISNDMTAKVDAVNKRLNEVLRPIVVTVPTPIGPVSKSLGVRHCQYPALLRKVMALSPERRNIWLAGPAGSGKTTAGHQLAEDLGLPFHFNGAIDTAYKLSGFIDATGRMIETAFYKAWKHGGVYLFDEIDRSLTAAVLAFNAPLANGHADFPDGVCERHPNTIILAAGNTWGHGGDANYIGAMKMDAAFLDRFVKQPWDYDDALERALAQHDQWVDVVQETRRLMRQHRATMVVSPRASIGGAELLRGGLSNEEVVDAIFGSYRSHSAWGMVGAEVERFARG